MSERAETLRGKTVHLLAGVTAVSEDVELRTCAQVFSYTLCGGFLDTDPPTPPPDPPELVATLKLADSEIELWSNCCSIRADLPRNVRWPDSAKLTVEPGCVATLTVNYGECDSRD